MSNGEDVPFVAIIGGFYSLTEDEADTAREAAVILGAALARAGFGLVVYYSDPVSLEPYVVQGFVGAVGDRPESIRVRYAQSQLHDVKFAEEQTKRGLFVHRVFPSEDWEAPFYQSLAEKEGVDAVLLLSGGGSTLIAGHIAVARELPVLAVDAFGGAAQKIWSHLAALNPSESLPRWQSDRVADLVAGLRSQCEDARRRRQESAQRARLYEAFTSVRTATVLCAVMFFVLLIAFLYGIIGAPNPSWFPVVTFTGLVCAGATGALVRTVISTAERDARVTVLLGSVAGFVVSLAYLIPQWIGAPGVLQPTQGAVTATDKIQFASAVLVAVSAGVGFDAVFRRLGQRAEEVPIGVDS